MARTWAMELAKAGITVNAIVPVAATEMTKTIPAFAPGDRGGRADGDAAPRVAAQGRGPRAPSRTSPSLRRLPRLRRRRRASPARRSASAATGSRCGRTRARRPSRSPTAAGAPTRSPRRGPPASAPQPETYGIPAPTVPRAVSAPAIDLDALIAIDVHTHAEVSRDGHGSLSPDAVRRLRGVLQGARPPAADHRRDGRLLPRAPDGRRGVHRRRRARHRARRGSPTRRSPRLRRARRRADPVRQRRPAQGPGRRPGGAHAWSRSTASRGFKFHPSIQGFAPERPRWRTRCTR